MSRSKKAILFTLGFLVLCNVLLVGRFYLGSHQAGQANAALGQNYLALPVVAGVEVIPLVESIAYQPGFKTEDGLSYLIRTGKDEILLDVGFNKNSEEHAPILYNINMMGIRLQDIDSVAISHNHADHVGGMVYREQRISLGSAPSDLGGKPMFSPIPMSGLGVVDNTVQRPQMIGSDIGTTGPLQVQMFVPGRLAEQMLLVNVKDKGLIVITGCGHPQIVEALGLVQKITGLPVYAVVGGLHLYYTPVESGFWRTVFGSNRLYCRGLTESDVRETAQQIKDLGVSYVYLSPHDSDQATQRIFAETFGTGYQTLGIGGKFSF